MKPENTYQINCFADLDGALAAGICIYHIQKLWNLNHSGDSKKLTFDIIARARTPDDCQNSTLYLKQNYNKIGIELETIEKYENFIDIVQIIHNESYVNKESKFDLESRVGKLRQIFYHQNPLIDSKIFYKVFVEKIAQHPEIEDFFDSEPFSHFTRFFHS